MKMDVVGKCLSRVDGDVVPSLVLGTTGKYYHGREVVVCRFPLGLFGALERGQVKCCTLYKGLLNQCTMQEPATPYWAVLDAMVELGEGFGRSSVVDLAVGTVGEGKREACRIAWAVLRNHHKHLRMRMSGMSYMVDECVRGGLRIRPRSSSETLQYFLSEGDRMGVASRVASEMGLGVLDMGVLHGED